MMRHTKQQVLGGEEVLQLPAKHEEVVAVVMTEAEQEMYRKAHEASAALWRQYRALGNATINKSLLQIMALLLPMRRICSGGLGLSCCAGWATLEQAPQYSSHSSVAPISCTAMRTSRLVNHACKCSFCRRQPEAARAGGERPPLWRRRRQAAPPLRWR
jgi:hypothetical protein